MFKHSCIMPLAVLLFCWPHTQGGAQNRELTAETTGHRYVFYTPGKEPAAPAKTLASLRLALSPCANRLTVMDYNLQAQVYQDSDIQKARHDGLHWSAQSERGITRYIPRITLTARNKPVEIGTVMVIEYFSQDLADKDGITREAVEHIPLVLTSKGQTIVFDGIGVPLFKSETQGSNLAGRISSSQQGKELLGMIISLFQEGELLYQQYAPAVLSKFCAPAMAEPQKPRHFQQGEFQPPPRPWRRGP